MVQWPDGSMLPSYPGYAMRIFYRLFNYLAVFTLLAAMSGPGMAQLGLLQERWLTLETEHFTFLSQLSARQTARFADELETWRQIAAHVIQGKSPFPRAPIPNYIYLFDDVESFQHFSVGQERAFFNPSPRSNFMAVLASDAKAKEDVYHHYVHFLLRNFSDLRLPRWYEEGLAGYLGRIQIVRGQAQFERFSQRENESMVPISETFSMDRLLYRDEALASPRVIQIANLKSQALLHYLKHGHEEEEFLDRRDNLQRYLELLLEGRNARFAFDWAFDVTTAQLDEELHNYLLNSSRPRGEINYGEVAENPPYQANRIEDSELAILLGELALNSGRLENAQLFFEVAMGLDASVARSLSGLADALRFQESEISDQTIAVYFEEAIALAPNQLDIVLDYGEYWESELGDCAKVWPANRRAGIIADIGRHFEKAMALAPESPEANLAMGQLYLLAGEDWQRGIDFQRKAFALLPADTFIMEQTVRYAIAADDYDEAERLITEIAQPIHSWGEPAYVSDLRERLLRKRRNEAYDVCAND